MEAQPRKEWAMTIDELKRLPRSEQKSLYSSFWMAYSAAARNNEHQRREYELILEQLQEIFELDQPTWMQWEADAAARELAISLALEEFLKSAA